MNKIYYLFSPSKKTEALFICNNSDYINKPYIKSAVYPIGIIFSKLMRTIMPVLINKPKSISFHEFSKGLVGFSKQDTSFSSICCQDNELNKIFNHLLSSKELYDNVDSEKAMFKLLRLNDYLSDCSKNRNLESIPIFNNRLSAIGERLPTYTIFDRKYKSDSKIFSPQLVKRTKPLFKIPDEKSSAKDYGKLVFPIYVYEITSIYDLIASSLQQIFENNYMITKCRFCGDYFVTKGKRKKYCPQSVGKSPKETCYYKNNKEQAIGIDDILKREYNSIRNMLMRNCNRDIEINGKNHQIYEEFKSRRKEYMKSIKRGKSTVEEYSKWLRSYYKYKYKK